MKLLVNRCAIAYLIGMMQLMLGCCIHRQSHPAAIVDFATRQQSDGATVNILWYHGTENGYDYFTYVFKMFGESCYRVPAGEIVVPETFPLTRDESQWRMVPNIGDYEFTVYPER